MEACGRFYRIRVVADRWTIRFLRTAKLKKLGVDPSALDDPITCTFAFV
jgi:hypothetical protein